MKKLSLAGVALAALTVGHAASAADMPLKAPPAPATYGWSGFYLGGNVGLSAARDPTVAPDIDTLFGPVQPNRFNLNPIGVIGGAQIGVNWQLSPHWVLGAEADFQASGQRDSTTCVVFCIDQTPLGPSFLGEKIAQKIPWFGTVRARLGWTNGPAMFYATGGFAYAKIVTDVDFLDQTVVPTSTANGSFSQNKSGWTAGAGIEHQIAGNWTGKIEYLYLDLGSVSDGAVLINGRRPGSILAFSSDVRDHIVRLGVNYKLGDPIYVAASPAAGIYKAPPAAQAGWSGFYVGGNFGLSVARNPASAPITAVNGALTSNEQFNLSPAGAVGGVQIGVNWQAAPSWVAGIEADFQASGQRDPNTCIETCTFTRDPPTVPLYETFSQRIAWFGTVRARAGWTNGPALFYATGGLAYGRVITDLNLFIGASGAPDNIALGSFTQDKLGWTAGTGIEARLAGNWTGKVEYLYVDLGTVSGSAIVTGGVAAGEVAAFSSRVHDHIVRVGLNFRFGPAAVYAKY